MDEDWDGEETDEEDEDEDCDEDEEEEEDSDSECESERDGEDGDGALGFEDGVAEAVPAISARLPTLRSSQRSIIRRGANSRSPFRL